MTTHGRAGSVTVAAALAVLVAVTACRPGTTPREPAQPSPVAVAVPQSATVADVNTYQPGAWLTAGQLPYGDAVRWRLVRNHTSAYSHSVAVLASSCGRYDQNAVADPNFRQVPDPSGELSQTFLGDPPGTATPGGRVFATETQWFYRSAPDAATAFAAYAAAFDTCVKAAGTAPPPGNYYPVTHTVRHTVTSEVAGAWVHLARYGNASPVTGGDGLTANSDNHEYAVVHGNVLAVLAMRNNSPVLDAATPDAALIRQIGAQLGSYDGPPAKVLIPLDPAADLWQPLPSPTQLPTAVGAEWSMRAGGGGVGEAEPGQAGALGNVACTRVTAGMPVNDPTLTGHRTYRYEESRTGTAATRPDSAAQVDLFTFTSSQAAGAGYATLLADLRSCQPRLRGDQTEAGLLSDAQATEIATGGDIAAWKVAGSGLFSQFPGLVMNSEPYRQHTQHLVLLMVRGPLLESIGVVIAPADAAAFTPAADLATADAAAADLCRLDIGC